MTTIYPSTLAHKPRTRCPDCTGPILREHVYGDPRAPRTLCTCAWCEWRQIIEVSATGEVRAITEPLADPRRAMDALAGGTKTTTRTPTLRIANALTPGEYQRWKSCGKPDMGYWKSLGMPTLVAWRRMEGVA